MRTIKLKPYVQFADKRTAVRLSNKRALARIQSLRPKSRSDEVDEHEPLCDRIARYCATQ